MTKFLNVLFSEYVSSSKTLMLYISVVQLLHRPDFPIALWNVHDAILEKRPRNNNRVETWHGKFQSMMRYAHPEPILFLEHLHE